MPETPLPSLPHLSGAPAVVLASGSAARAAMLAQAGVSVTRDAANVDEEEVKISLRGSPTATVAETLAELKALHVSRRHPVALVIGADQMLECEGRLYDKPVDLDGACQHLRSLRGRTHHLVTSAVVVLDGARLWHHTDRAALTMRSLSDGFIETYLAALGRQALQSVGAYQLEGLGAQLFARVEGDFFTILGLPLLPLCDFLRARGVLQT